MGDQRNVARVRPRTWRQLAGQQRRVDEEDDDRQWPSWLMIIGLFAMIVAFWWVSAVVLVSYWTVGRLFCAFAFGGNLLYGGWTHRVSGMSRGYWFMFNLLAIGPFLFCSFFALNAAFTNGDEAYLVHYERHQDLKGYWIEHGELAPWILSARGTTFLVRSPQDTVGQQIKVLRISEGLLGFGVMSLSEPVWIAPDRSHPGQ
jgi:hypothetical protein